MNNHNILKYYGSKLDAKLDSSEYYDYELGRNETDYSTDILDLSTIITYTGLTFDSSVCLNTPINDLKPYKNEVDVDLITDNCSFKIRRRTEDGWTLDFIFNRNGLTWNNGNVFYYVGIEDETDIENYADNNLSFAFTSDGRIKWESYRYSGYCGVSALTETYYIDSGQTPTLCSGGTLNDFNVTITFKRYYHYTNCAIENEGGQNDLIMGLTLDNSYYAVLTGDTPIYSNIETLNEKWTKERNKRLGVLKIYLNGNPIYTLENWEEIIPSRRNSINSISQIFGGGTTGIGNLHEGLCNFIIKNAAYYEEPIDHVHVKHHYLSENSLNNNISECGTPCVPIIIPLLTPTPTITPSMSITPSLTPSVSATIVPIPTPSMSMTPSLTPTPSTAPPTSLELTFDSISNTPVVDPTDIFQWNTFFGFDTDPSLYTTIFNSVTVIGNIVKLYGGSGITAKEGLFDNSQVKSANSNLLNINDLSGCIIMTSWSFEYCTNITSYNLPSLQLAGNSSFSENISVSVFNLPNLIIAEDYAFASCYNTNSFILPKIATIGNQCFDACYLVTEIYIPMCITLGITTGNDGVFHGITGQTITLTINPDLMTCNGGLPDGDICYLCSNNNVTVNGVSNYTCSSSGLKLSFDSISNTPVIDPTDVGQWNTFFGFDSDPSLYTTIFSFVTVDGNIIKLYGGSGITLKESLFNNNINLVEVNDIAGSVVTINNSVFEYCENVLSFNFSSLITAGDDALSMTFLCRSFSAPLLETAGARCFYDLGYGLINPEITITLPSLLSVGDDCFGDNINTLSFDLPLLNTAGNGSFSGCAATLSFSFPSLVTCIGWTFLNNQNTIAYDLPLMESIGDSGLAWNYGLTSINISSCINLGTTTGDNSVFNGITGQTITLTVPSALMTCNIGGTPDGDIQYLQANNIVTIITT